MIYHYDEIESTSDLIKTILPPKRKVVIWADTQTRGRGRKKRDWSSPRGGLWFTLLWVPERFPREFLPYIVKISALSIVDLLLDYNISPKIKPPNDVYVNGKKIAGILIDTEIKADNVEKIYIGIGLNVKNSVKELSSDLEDIAIAMCDVTENVPSLNILLFKILENIFSYFHNIETEKFLDKLNREWKEFII